PPGAGRARCEAELQHAGSGVIVSRAGARDDRGKHGGRGLQLELAEVGDVGPGASGLDRRALEARLAIADRDVPAFALLKARSRITRLPLHRAVSDRREAAVRAGRVDGEELEAHDVATAARDAAGPRLQTSRLTIAEPLRRGHRTAG